MQIIGWLRFQPLSQKRVRGKGKKKREEDQEKKGEEEEEGWERFPWILELRG